MAKNLSWMITARAWSALLMLGLVPVYVRLIGVEAYGVVGAFVTLQSFMSLLDLGFAPTLTREFARLSAASGGERQMRELLRTFEVMYYVVAILIALAIWLLAPAIADHWLRLGKLSPVDVWHGIAVGGVSFALQWPKNLYSAGLEGLQRQTVLARNIWATATLRAVATILALRYIAPTLEVFFLGQACGNIVQTVFLGTSLWARLAGGFWKAAFRPRVLRGVWRFATGMTAISITAVALTQLDKAILSKTLPLRTFGYYVIASTLASGLYVLIGPLFAVAFPRFSELVSQSKTGAVAQFYDLSSQLMSVVILPIAAVVAVYSPEILGVWTRNPQIVANGHLLLSLLIAGNAMNGLMNMPYAMQLAYGWTSLALYSNIIAIVICAPLTYVLSVHLGAQGGAIVWVCLTFGYIITSLPVMHARLLPGHLLRWYLVDVGQPALAALAVVEAAHLVVPHPSSVVEIIALLIVLTGAAAVAAALAAPNIRQIVAGRLQAFGAVG